MLFLGLFVFHQPLIFSSTHFPSLPYSAGSLSTIIHLSELLKMESSHQSFTRFILLMLAFSAFSSQHVVHGQLTKVGFYSSKCPQVESVVRSTVEGHLSSNPAIAPGLLRMFFHDCFVHGCDASILIAGPSSERTARQNSNLRGFEVIDDAKTQLEAVCPGIVSCADILAIAARDVVFLSKGPSWEVPTGRRDGRVSLASDAADLPGARDSVAEQVRKFTEKNLNTLDLVALVGGHSIGTAACNQFRYRLFNFSTTTANGADPTIDPAFLPELQALCPQNGDGSRRVDMDTDSWGRLDESFFVNLMNRRGVLESDQRLWEDLSTQGLVRSFVGGRGSLGLNFNREFSKSMVKMSNIGVKSGSEGEIRTVCSAVN